MCYITCLNNYTSKIANFDIILYFCSVKNNKWRGVTPEHHTIHFT